MQAAAEPARDASGLSSKNLARFYQEDKNWQLHGSIAPRYSVEYHPAQIPQPLPWPEQVPGALLTAYFAQALAGWATAAATCHWALRVWQEVW